MNFTKTIVNAMMTWVNKRFKENTPNWNQNDSSADGYIKNRPFYSKGFKYTVVMPTTTVSISSSQYTTVQYSPIIPLEVGQTYNVTWNGESFECVAALVSGIAVIGNFASMGGADTGEPFFIAIDEDMFGGAYVVSLSAGEYACAITANLEDVVKIPKKYIPDLGLAQVATSGSYNDLSNKPTIYNDPVRYSVLQGLTDAQKNRARTNIGAANDSEIVKVVSQTLTDEQKEIARTNIGAGTSSFSGSYNDLTDIPEQVQADWDDFDTTISSYIKNKPFGTEVELTPRTCNQFERVSTTIHEASGLYVKGLYINYLAIDITDLGKTLCVEVNGVKQLTTCRSTKTIANSNYDSVVIGNAKLGVDAEIINESASSKDTGEDWCYVYNAVGSYNFISKTEDAEVTNLYDATVTLKYLDEKFIPDTIARTSEIPDAVINPTTATVGQVIAVKAVDSNGKPSEWEAVDHWTIGSSTEGSTKQFKITIDDDGVLTATEIVT